MDYASSTALVTTVITSLGGQIFTILTAVLALWGALLAGGFGISRLKKYIQRRKA